ncbi:MAG TPA: hypothetical protein VGQ32_08770 [Thermoanaerobaculia bacterium]|jgi:hypothetical protein|nr:hypothetical protein [Thermoanaerobaculia bacterium]
MESTQPVPREKWWRRKPMQASGIVRVRTQILRRMGRYPGGRKLPRPPLAVNLFLLAVGIFGGLGAYAHRRSLDARLATLLRQDSAAPFQIKKIRRDLAELETDEATLSSQLDARLAYARAQKAQEFYLVLDRAKRRFAFKYADRVVRDGCFDIGGPDSISDGHGSHWSFPPLTGAFSVEQKLEQPAWKLPEWVYAMKRESPPRDTATIPGGLGRYVVEFAGGYVLHSPPPPDSPLKGARPGSFMIPEQDFGAIWRRIGPGTRIYVF